MTDVPTTSIVNAATAPFTAAPGPGGSDAGEIVWAAPGRAGIWRADARTMSTVAPYPFDRDEVVYVIDGAVRVELEDGTAADLGPGDLAHFRAGQQSTWHFTFPFAKVSVLL
ncbi:cupin domain-containing protein [Curtobacterium sp. VKM Ac-1376]|uniref:cupin domain-containing protein n=1 Tax=Curtobacterium sp. VKM Ac-1376 TaxID=123312 RepID=UPI00188C1BFC|nr:cupin domain-containing protein [Curtobacterium sp. VKM Ac-1376]MBF4616028.1 DUF861 domain-containing protein [Curtobacterium sp. VKM Ac-1376]